MKGIHFQGLTLRIPSLALICLYPWSLLESVGMIGQGNSLFSLYSRLNSSLCIPSGRVNVSPADFLLAALKLRLVVNLWSNY